MRCKASIKTHDVVLTPLHRREKILARFHRRFAQKFQREVPRCTMTFQNGLILRASIQCIPRHRMHLTISTKGASNTAYQST